MLMNSSKMIFLKMMVISTIMMISSMNLMFSWISMEINLIMFIPMLTKSKKLKDQPMKYFIIQSLSSSMLLIAMLMNSKIESPINLSMLMMASMLMKMGLMPFHLWLPSIMQKMSWKKCMILSTWQKISPTILICQLISMKEMIFPMMISLILSPMSMIKSMSTKKIMAFSSINNMPWMIMSMMISKNTFFTFFVIYSMINIMLMNNFKNLNINFMNQMIEKKKNMKINLIVNFLSMSGFPPTIGFFLKWMILQKMMNLSKFLSMIMIISSLISSFIYLKMTISMFTMMNSKKKNSKSKMFTSNNITMNLLMTLTFMFLKPN
uniref:NADH-ubiquinone oxidoreductase chain 2 n=1 Tax=Bambusicaliscelis fanjingensis TaxID=2820089 RepID=A0A8A4VNC3_9HEMI|nr:NADH dehydrogenase subunit 2 [Bambusicaliscelis fanjingensis]QTD82413.1 NADH dehydrogenase subunit 2 [Bambusicaliscelis fanjingensis]